MQSNLRSSPFCGLSFKKLGNHLAHCKQRDGRDYQHLLSHKTLAKKTKSRRQSCPTCKSFFLRLETHLRLSRSCQVHQTPANIEPVHQAMPSQPALPLHQPPCSLSPSQEPLQLPSLKLPATEEDWLKSDRDLARSVVPAVLAAPTVNAKNEALCQGIYHYFSCKYGCVSRRKPRRKRWHARRLKSITAEKNEVRKQFRQAKASGNSLLVKELAQNFYRLVRLRSAEKKILLKSKCRFEALKAHRECSKAFWRYAARVLDGEGESIVPDFDAHRAEEFFSEVYSATAQVFSQPSWLPCPPPPSVDFNMSDISEEEISHVIRCSKSGSSASPLDGIGYKILKRCPSLLPALLDLFDTCWSTASVPQAWKQAVVRLIPKGSAASNSSDPVNFRPIALTPCVGKLFTSILRNRFLPFMLQNGYMDTNVQKAFVNGLPGCTEHHCKLGEVIKEATVKHKSLNVCWLDLANAYGSVSHALIQFALHHYNVPVQFANTISGLYSGLSATITSAKWATPFVSMQTGVYQGDPLSVVIFNTIMCTLVDAFKPLQHLGYNLSGTKLGIHLLQYADDTCLVANGPSSC